MDWKHNLHQLLGNATELVRKGQLADATINGNADLNKPIGALDQIGTGAGRLIGCATGASSMREFGNCMLTGQLGNVPAAPGAAPGGQ